MRLCQLPLALGLLETTLQPSSYANYRGIYIYIDCKADSLHGKPWDGGVR